jgi:hypothetical protein
MAEPLTRAVLDRTPCSTLDCTHEDHSAMWMHSNCHPRAGVVAIYFMADGVMQLQCRKCKRLICAVAVAP